MEVCARAIIAKNTPVQPAGRPEQTEVVWRVKCRQCRFEAESISTGNAAEAIANAHCAVHRHEVVIRYSIVDCLYRMVKPEEARR